MIQWILRNKIIILDNTMYIKCRIIPKSYRFNGKILDDFISVDFKLIVKSVM